MKSLIFKKEEFESSGLGVSLKVVNFVKENKATIGIVLIKTKGTETVDRELINIVDRDFSDTEYMKTPLIEKFTIKEKDKKIKKFFVYGILNCELE